MIQSKNSAAHTVQFNNGASINVDKFVAVGSSSSNRLTLKYTTEYSTPVSFNISTNGSSYGQYVTINGLSANGSPTVPHYIGSNSNVVYSAGSRSWLLQDPPKISTLVDHLTTAPGSNTNWSTLVRLPRFILAMMGVATR